MMRCVRFVVLACMVCILCLQALPIPAAATAPISVHSSDSAPVRAPLSPGAQLAVAAFGNMAQSISTTYREYRSALFGGSTTMAGGGRLPSLVHYKSVEDPLFDAAFQRASGAWNATNQYHYVYNFGDIKFGPTALQRSDGVFANASTLGEGEHADVVLALTGITATVERRNVQLLVDIFIATQPQLVVMDGLPPALNSLFQLATSSASPHCVSTDPIADQLVTRAEQLNVIFGESFVETLVNVTTHPPVANVTTCLLDHPRVPFDAAVQYWSNQYCMFGYELNVPVTLRLRLDMLLARTHATPNFKLLPFQLHAYSPSVHVDAYQRNEAFGLGDAEYSLFLLSSMLPLLDADFGMAPLPSGANDALLPVVHSAMAAHWAVLDRANRVACKLALIEFLNVATSKLAALRSYHQLFGAPQRRLRYVPQLPRDEAVLLMQHFNASSQRYLMRSEHAVVAALQSYCAWNLTAPAMSNVSMPAGTHAVNNSYVSMPTLPTFGPHRRNMHNHLYTTGQYNKLMRSLISQFLITPHRTTPIMHAKVCRQQPQLSQS